MSELNDSTITELILNNSFDEAIEKSNEVREDLIRLRDYSKRTDQVYLYRWLSKAIQKI